MMTLPRPRLGLWARMDLVITAKVFFGGRGLGQGL
jgi:hypothetical protein